MAAVFANVRIDTIERFEHFKESLNDLRDIFQEYHVKVRGSYASECIQYAQSVLEDRLYTYQQLPSDDWVESAKTMLSNIKSNTIHIFLEDHKRLCSKKVLSSVLTEFAAKELDYMPYSFFRSSQLDTCNILPLGVAQGENFFSFTLDSVTYPLLSKISPGYYTFSLCSVVSRRYFALLLSYSSQSLKVYSSKILTIGIFLFGYPRYRTVLSSVNRLLKRFNSIICIYPPNSPFNLERCICEDRQSLCTLSFGVPRRELFANFDDDNGVYGESLIKRGRTHPLAITTYEPSLPASPIHRIHLKPHENFDLTYYSRKHRISSLPEIRISVKSGTCLLNTVEGQVLLEAGKDHYLFTNSSPLIISQTDACLEYQVYDVIFSPART